MIPTGVKELFEERDKGADFTEICETYEDLRTRIEPSADAYSGEDFGEPKRIRVNTVAYRQVLLHRAIFLFEGSLEALVASNPYSMALSIRGHFESTASLGYLHRRLTSLQNGDVPPETVDRDLCDQMLGGRHESLTRAPDPKNVLTMLEYADKSFNTAILKATTKAHKILADSYEFLCEFCHPNFHSNSLSMELDKSVPCYRFRYDAPMRDREFDLIGYLLFSAPIFVALFDDLPNLLPHTN